MHHPAGCLLCHKKGAKTCDLQRGARGCRIKIGDRAGHTRRRIVDHQIRGADFCIDSGEQPVHRVDRSGITQMQAGTRFGGNIAGFLAGSCCQRDGHAIGRTTPRKRRAEPRPGANDKSG